MKKKLLIIISIVIAFSFIVSCNNSDWQLIKPIEHIHEFIDGKCECGEEIILNKGSYIFEEKSYGLYPCVTLHDDNKFTFVFSSISSYIGFGEYVVDNDCVYLHAEDGQYWCFIIVDDHLIYDETKSNGSLWFSNIKNGSSFKLQEKGE